MKELAPQDRPREKLERAGVGSLGDNELLAVLIGHGTARASALGVANRLLASARGVHGLTRMSRDELVTVPGVGTAVAARGMGAGGFGRPPPMLSPAAPPAVLRP